ncbi:MAG: nicotinate-nucleotide adenylyltransferase [Defluviitaleaceae bacterium]|nr:nicotinate-nucleotide adenylyltransferase [Defluviitaleaceae bacterium]
MEEFKNLKSIAILGGTFDPVHYGHLAIAEAVRKEYGVEKIVFIPSGQPPHKKDMDISNKEDRYNMLKLATANNPHFIVSRCELDRDGYSYTVDTIEYIKSICDDNTKIYFIIGADIVPKISTWKEPERLKEICDFIIVSRPGFPANNTLIVPSVDISSSAIRNRVKEGKGIKYLLPPDVEIYVYVKHKLSSKKFTHIVNTMETSRNLALVHGEDIKKAEIAALLHDYAKEMPLEHPINHGIVAAEMARNEFGIYDIDILNAISYHTTGRPNMSRLEKIIFLADMTEKNRPNYKELEEIKKLAKSDLDKAMAFALSAKIEFTKSKGKDIHPLGLEALKYYENK